LGLPSGPGAAWVLAIVALTIIMRAAMMPLFFKQIVASRGQQMIQPELKALQEKYKDKKDPASREAMSRETMELYKKHNTNPFSSCLPILLQTPIFFALFRVLNAIGPIAAGERLDANGVPQGIGPITQVVAQDIQASTLFGAHLSDTFTGTTSTVTRIVIALLIILMSASTFYTQRQLTMKNMPQAALEGQAANMQRMMLYTMPIIFAITGINFPVGVLIYLTVTNFWSMGQQYYAIKRMPAPGSQAEADLRAKKAARAAAKGIVLEPAGLAAGSENDVIEITTTGQRQQPQRKNRNRKS
jgi:YidC/Oxa1 family membrane protein insertase